MSKSARHLKRGMAVAVCYDGKWGRRMKGEVIRTDRGSRVLVRFPLWAEETETVVEHWFKRRRADLDPQRQYFGGYVPREFSVMKHFFGMPGDWYAVYRWPASEGEGK